MAKITAPAPVTTVTSYGPISLDFADGVAEVDELPDALKAYLLGAGYTVDGEQITDPAPTELEVPDPRDLGDGYVGTRLRDAAVDPQPGDFLAPINAGEANPHGPDVVSPQIHASQGIRPVKPGDVHVDDPAAQEAAELEHLTAAVDGTPINDGEVYAAEDSSGRADGEQVDRSDELQANAEQDEQAPAPAKRTRSRKTS